MTGTKGVKARKAKHAEKGEKAGPRTSATFVNKLPPGKLPMEGTADLVAEGIVSNTVALRQWSLGLYGDIDVTSLQGSIEETVECVNRGDLRRAEGMLMSQALTLNAIFVNLASRAHRTQYLEQVQGNMRLALKAQGQCRATVETLASIKNPPVFARQANIANGPQQVNNGGVLNTTASRAGIQEAAPNEVLEVGNARLDRLAPSAPGESHSSVAPLAEINRAAYAGRKETVVPERLPRRHA